MMSLMTFVINDDDNDDDDDCCIFQYNFSLPYESQLQDLLTTLYNMTEEEEKCRKYMPAITKRLREAKI